MNKTRPKQLSFRVNDIAICSSGSGYDYSFFQYFSLYTTDFGIPDHHRFSSAA